MRRLLGVIACAVVTVPSAGAATLVAVTPAATRLLERSDSAALVSPRLGVWRLDDTRLLPALRRRNALLASEPDARLRPAGHITAGDPLLPNQWWLTAVGADRIEPPGPGRPVTVIDSGVDLSHPEFSSRPNTVSLNAQVLGTERADAHGTAVASIVGAPANGVGIVGVYPQAALQLFDAGVLSRSDLIAGLDAAIARGPGVINFSLGFESEAPQPVLELAIDKAFATGSLIVAAAGNSGPTSGREIPADLPHVLTVAASDQLNEAAPFSSRSFAVDLAAPGVDIQAAVPLFRDPSGYTTLSGTSFAAPIVSGAAAWIWTRRPTLTNTQLFEVIRFSAKDAGRPGFDADTGFGILNIPAALAKREPPSDPQEPNEDILLVRPGGLRPNGVSALKAGSRLDASLDSTEDPRDVYRVTVAARKAVSVSVEPDADVTLVAWRPQTRTVRERGALRRRDVVATSAQRGKQLETVVVRNRGNRSAVYYLDVSLAAGAADAVYLLSVRATP